MKITKIEIDTTNKKHRTDIAILVDKIEFLRDIQELRNKWNIKTIYDPTQFDKFLNWDIAGDKDRISNPKVTKKRLDQFNNDIIALRNKYNRTKNFDIVIKCSVGFNRIPEWVYKSCYWDKILISPTDNPEDTKNYQYAIIVTPRTEKKEVEEAYNELQEHIRNKIEFHKHDISYNEATEDEIKEHVFGAVYPASDITKFKTLKELDRTREWFWIAYKDQFNGLSKKRKRSEDILDEWITTNCPAKKDHDTESTKNCPYCSVNDVNEIDQALSTYSKLLAQS